MAYERRTFSKGQFVSYWHDINGVRRETPFVPDVKPSLPHFRRFCSDCGKLRKCYVHRDIVRCEECSKRAGVPTIRDAGMQSVKVACTADLVRRFAQVPLTPRYY
jgi:hypothetical protein